MKINIELIKIDYPWKNNWSFYLFPTIYLDYEKDSFSHGKQFVIAIAFLFWSIEIEFNEY